MKFLSGYDFNPIHIDISVKNFITEGIYLGKGRQALEIVVLRSQEKPNSKLIQQIFNKREMEELLQFFSNYFP